jgi:hypothetical protein
MVFKKIKTMSKTTTLGLVHQSSFLPLKYSFSSILDLIGFKLLTNLLKSQQPECKPKFLLSRALQSNCVNVNAFIKSTSILREDCFYRVKKKTNAFLNTFAAHFLKKAEASDMYLI